ncbi:hypothetical protein ALC53_05868 [Atta colombica]|uniref:Uncharacterized protein n=1 Tax=Atta colombica TaxID=520822 RepID=A0A151I3J7_9HYME|nr:hypothetical protein ALC53_05868 [Atta colombica]
MQTEKIVFCVTKKNSIFDFQRKEEIGIILLGDIDLKINQSGKGNFFHGCPTCYRINRDKSIPMYKKIEHTSNYASPELHELSYELSKQSLQTQQFREELHNQLGALGQKYVNMLLNDDREKAIDHIYAYSLSARIVRCSVKYFDVDTNDFVIANGVKYKDTLVCTY